MSYSSSCFAISGYQVSAIEPTEQRLEQLTAPLHRACGYGNRPARLADPRAVRPQCTFTVCTLLPVFIVLGPAGANQSTPSEATLLPTALRRLVAETPSSRTAVNQPSLRRLVVETPSSCRLRIQPFLRRLVAETEDLEHAFETRLIAPMQRRLAYPLRQQLLLHDWPAICPA